MAVLPAQHVATTSTAQSPLFTAFIRKVYVFGSSKESVGSASAALHLNFTINGKKLCSVPKLSDRSVTARLQRLEAFVWAHKKSRQRRVTGTRLAAIYDFRQRKTWVRSRLSNYLRRRRTNPQTPAMPSNARLDGSGTATTLPITATLSIKAF